MKLFVKRMLSVALAACMAIGSAAALNAEKIGDLTASFAVKAAATIVDSGECGAEGANVTWTLDSDGLLTISGTGKMYDYSWNEAPWENSDVISVVISEGVTNIGDYAFDYCTGLTSITIPSGVTSIGESAFRSCDSLTSITIPDSVTSIGERAFFYCTGLTSITIPEGVTSIDGSAFSDVPNIVYSGTASGSPWGARALNGYIEDGLVYEDSSKTELLACPSSREGTVVIPSSVTSIGEYAFFHCTGLTSITIPDSITSIRDGAFCQCSSLTSITIPDGVNTIGNYAFDGCSNLASVMIPDSVTTIGSGAFNDCENLAAVDIPSGVKTIGSRAFDGCSSLASITIPDSVKTIENYAFFGCSNLASVTIPDSIDSMGLKVFSGTAFYNDVDNWHDGVLY